MRSFEPDEQLTVARLEELGIVGVVPVGRLRGMATPDAAIPAVNETLEFKHPRSNCAEVILRALDDARYQSRRLVLDLRWTDVVKGDAVTWLEQALRCYGGGYDEVLVLGRDFGILWP